MHAPAVCQICDGEIDTMFIDGKTIMGSWAYMCPGCHETVGVGLGTGRGQKYECDYHTRVCKKIEG
jgi:hypothetical protein